MAVAETARIDKHLVDRPGPRRCPCPLPSGARDRVEQTLIRSTFAPEGWMAAEVHQAEGVLAARLNISVPEAIATIRTIAHRAGTPLIDVARHILAGPERVD